MYLRKVEMTEQVPRFGLRYIPEELLGGIPKYKTSEEASASDWTRVISKRHAKALRAGTLQLNMKALTGWTEKSTRIAGKREGRATWTNTKSGVEITVVYKSDMIQSLSYYSKCEGCAENRRTTCTYTHGRRVNVNTTVCYCAVEDDYDYGGSGCGCGDCGLCLCMSAERQWDRSYGGGSYW
jgi:hypothetical protein